MSCGCGNVGKDKLKRETMRKLAIEYAKEMGGVVVFYRCADYDFTTLENFNPNGKTEIEYFM